VIPTAVAREARENLLDYLRTTYNLADLDFERALFEHLGGPEGLFRGPYLDIRLPFRQVRPGTQLPLDIAPSFRPWRHQMRAFERLHGQRGHQPQHTLVTTGTGSGKTECFLFPILDHCWRLREHGKRGIKAILLYPMNALATDQARRLARTLWDDPRLKGRVTAGLYIGGDGSHTLSDRDHLIDDRRVLRQAPPDILLTNYRMLDFLLLRPEDQVLWRDNGPETLRFLVLDELHTYDGAQGSDVACLIRRLKARLAVPAGGLCCVGTSATIGEGDEGSKDRLIEFAHEIFDEAFFSDSVITEDRLNIEEALGATHDLEIHPGTGEVADLDPRGKSPAEWMKRQKEMWLGPKAGELSPVEVGEHLQRHDFLHQLLRVIGGKGKAASEILERLGAREDWFAALDRESRALVLDSFAGLVSHARRLSDPDAEGNRKEVPFLSVQVQLWVREVRNLLRAVEVAPRFRWRSELGGKLARGDDRTRYLPMVRCRECGCVGLAAVQHEGEQRLRDDSDEREIGRAWLGRSPSARFVVFGHGLEREGQKEAPEFLCPRCLRVSHEMECGCEGTSTPSGFAVRVVREMTGDQHPRFRPLCPECGSDDSLVFLASRASSLLSVGVSHLYQTEYNEDRKLLAFVDSVQDASHRAGFFGARTYRFNLRALIQEMTQSKGGRVALTEVGARLLEHARGRPDLADRAVPVLVPEDLRQHPDFERYLEQKGKGSHDELHAWLASRLTLEVTFEYGYSVRLGRSLEQTGCSTLEIDPERLAKAARELVEILTEEGPLESRKDPLDEGEARHFLAGLLNRLRLRGGIYHDLIEQYARSAGDPYFLSKKRNPLGPVFGPDSVLPRFLIERPPRAGKRSAFDAFGAGPDKRTWYRDWAARALGLDREDDGIVTLYRIALDRLERSGILRRVETQDQVPVWGLDPASLAVVDGVHELVCPVCKELVRVPAPSARAWSGRTCTKFRCTGRWGDPAPVRETFYTRTFQEGRVAPVFPEEHTGLLSREAREKIEERFKATDSPNGPNLLVCTPTLEMGIDIGDLSAVMLCSVPPATTNYLQRIGRAGRSTGNALCVTMANARPHELYFHADPPAMMSGAVEPPGCFLDAPEMLKRQIVAHAMDAWARQEKEIQSIPPRTSAVLVDGAKFPRRFLEFYAERKQELLRDFLSRFERTTLGDVSREELERFALSDQVAERIHRAFDDVRQERVRLKRLQDAARERLEELEADPDKAQDDPEAEKAEARANQRMLGRLIVELGKRYPLNVLTDAGVLPNYAFPEPGVELHSVIQVDHRGQRRYEAHQYLRPASAAIRELAPFNSFYAESRRVKVDELDLGTPAQPLIETWRLCAACNHMRREEGESTPVEGCPSCGDSRWTDVGQLRKLVYFRRSRSLSTRLEAASADEGEERQRKSYQTHDLIDVQPENRNGARLIEELPFGSELLTRLRLREINFGPEGEGSFLVAGHEVDEDGFQVCRDCGRVRPEEHHLALDHAPTCRTRKGREPQLESVYLYREVESEAIRLLLPIAELDLDVQQASFRAALELGMRRRYGGRAPHLRIKAMREPIRGGGHRNFLVIFDTVPGGTGFLADLWRDDALMDVLADMLEALRTCSCLAQDRDGCYRCLFAYQNQRDLERTSSAAARKMLEGILALRGRLKDVDTLSDVVLDSKLESELEERFIRALVAKAKHGGSTRKILKEGEERWEIVANEKRWEVRPQVRLGSSEGVEVPCQPDFLIVPLTSEVDPRPVAVFCDGFRYHVQPEHPTSRLGDDIEKRRAILESGRYLVWSVTWKDVEDFEAGEAEKGTSLFDREPSKPGLLLVQRWSLTPDFSRGTMNSMELLWSWLRFPDEREWRRKIAAIGATLIVREKTIEPPTIEQIEKELWCQPEPGGPDPVTVAVAPGTPMFGQLESRFGLKLLGRIGAKAMAERRPRTPIWILRLYDDQKRRQDPAFEGSWRAFLQAMNLLQFVEGFFFTSTEDLARRRAAGGVDYPLLQPMEGHLIAAEAPTTGVPVAEGLEGLDLLEDEHKIAAAVLAAGGPRPEVGYELEGPDGRCRAEAQLAWPGSKVAVLLRGEPADTAAFEESGWRVFTDPERTEGIVAAIRITVSASRKV